METIDDIRREEGNPRASGPVGGKPRSVFSFFTQTTGAQLVAMVLMAVAFLALVLGAILFVTPLLIAGLGVLVLAFFGYVWAKPKRGIV